MRRALTLIELMASLALLGSIAMLCGNWTQAASRSAAAIDEPMHERSACEAFFLFLQDLIDSGDFEPANRNRPEPLPRVQVVDGRLCIRTRMPGIGATEVRLSFDPYTGELRVEHTSPSVRPRTRLLLSGLGKCHFVVDEDERTLHVRLRFTSGSEFERTFSWP